MEADGNALTLDDVELILESLRYTRLKFHEYQGYPSADYRQSRVNEVVQVIRKVKEMKRTMKCQNEC